MSSVLVENALIRTMDLARPLARSVLIRDGVVAALSDLPDGLRDQGNGVRRVDTGGRLVLPGFQDAHIHLLNGGTDLVETAQLYDCTTLEEIAATMRDHAARWTRPDGLGCGLAMRFLRRP